MSKNELTLAGWAAIINGIITIPLFIIGIVLIIANNSGTRPIQVILGIIGTLLSVYILSAFKNFLNKKHKFFGVDVYINIFIISSLAYMLLDTVALVFKNLDSLLTAAALVFLFATGIIQVVFSIKLLKLAKEIKPMEAFAYVSLITGVGTATIILFPLALIFSVISDIILGIIFFRASEDAK